MPTCLTSVPQRTSQFNKNHQWIHSHKHTEHIHLYIVTHTHRGISLLHSAAASSSATATGCASLAQTKTAECGTLAASESKLGPNWPTNRAGLFSKSCYSCCCCCCWCYCCCYCSWSWGRQQATDSSCPTFGSLTVITLKRASTWANLSTICAKKSSDKSR